MAKNLGYNQEYWNNPDKPLSAAEYDKIGQVSVESISYQFGSDRKADGWNRLKEKLGLEINPGNREIEYTDEEIKKDVLGAGMAKDQGYNGPWENPDKPLSEEEYNEVGKVSADYISKKFSSENRDYDGWNNLKEELGLKISPRNKYSEEKIKKDVLGAMMAKAQGYKEEAWKSDGHLSIEEYIGVGKASGRQIINRFKSEGSQGAWRGLRSEVEKEALERQGHDGEDLLPSEEEGREEEIMEELTSSPDKEDVPDYMQP